MIILFFFTTPSFAQEPLLSVNVSNNSFEEGDTIVIFGKVATIILDDQVTISIFNEGNLIEIAQLVVAQDGSFTHTILAEGQVWQKEGEYTVRAFYGGSNVETNFQFFLHQDIVKLSDYYEVDASPHGTFDVEYIIRGGNLISMDVEPRIFALIVRIEPTSDGSIILDLPRVAIDAKKSDGSDDIFIVTVDDVEVRYEEAITNKNTRTLTIQFEEDESDIIVIGTQIIPEFGTIASLILAVSIISVIILSTKKKILGFN